MHLTAVLLVINISSVLSQFKSNGGPAVTPKLPRMEDLELSLTVSKFLDLFKDCQHDISVFHTHLNMELFQTQLHAYIDIANPQKFLYLSKWARLDSTLLRHVQCFFTAVVIGPDETDSVSLSWDYDGREHINRTRMKLIPNFSLIFCPSRMSIQCNTLGGWTQNSKYAQTFVILFQREGQVSRQYEKDTSSGLQLASFGGQRRLVAFQQGSFMLYADLRPQNLSVGFECSNVERCYMNMIQSYRKWHTEFNWTISTVRCTPKHGGAHVGPTNGRRPFFSVVTLSEYLLRDINGSRCEEQTYFGLSLKPGHPQILYMLNTYGWLHYHDMHVFQSSDPESVFVTSENVVETKSSINVYVFPLQLRVWLSLFITLAVTAIFLSWAQFGRSLGNHKIVCNSLWRLAASLLEQYHIAVAKKAELSPGPVRFVRSLWLLLTIFVCTGYKCAFKSNYVLEPLINTNWTHLYQLENFSKILFVIPNYDTCHENVLSHNIDKHNAPKNDKLSITRRFCWSTEGKEILASQYYRLWACSHVIEYEDFKTFFYSAKQYQQNCSDDSKGHCPLRRFDMLQRILTRTEFICDADIVTELEGSLISAKTALVMRKDSFHTYWKRINDHSSKKFYHNFKIRDDTFRRKDVLFVTSKVMWMGVTKVQQRLRAFASSGLVDLQKRLDRENVYSNITKYLSRTARARITYAPISFKNSDIHLIFVLFLGLMGVSVLIYSMDWVRLRKHFIATMMSNLLIRAGNFIRPVDPSTH